MTGSNNTAGGDFALLNNTTGSHNIGTGRFSAGLAFTSGDNNIDIGNIGMTGESNTIPIAQKATQTATFIAGISGVGVSGNP